MPLQASRRPVAGPATLITHAIQAGIERHNKKIK